MRRYAIAWVGALLVAAVSASGVYDLMSSREATLRAAGRELDTQARVIAEQTARSLQAVDVVLRHLSAQFGRSGLRGSEAELHAMLKDQAVGFAQVDGFVLIRPDGRLRAASYIEPGKAGAVSVASTDTFRFLSAGRHDGLYIDGARRSEYDGRWLYPISRRLETPGGEFAGVVAARGRIDYFQDFYRDSELGPGTRTALLHNNGTLLARHPPAPDALGQPLTGAALVAIRSGGTELPLRTRSPIDGTDRLGVARAVPDYPLTVVVTRDAEAVLAPWRKSAIGAGVRGLALSALAVLLLVLLARQMSRLYEARESLEASRERFALAVAGSNDGIVDWDVVNDRMYSSRRAMEVVGIDSDVEVRSRAEWRDLVVYHPDDAPRMKRDLDDFLEGRTELRDGEYRVLVGKETYRWVRIRNTCVRDAQARPLRVAGSVSDIDAWKRAEEALRASEEQYRAIFNAAADALILRDAEARIVDVNPAFLQISGHLREEVLQSTQWMFAAPEDLEMGREMHRRVIAGESVHFELKARRKDGAAIDVDMRAVPIRYRGRPHALGMARDITTQKRAAAERAQLEGQLLQAKKLEAIGTLAGGIAHDFNNILSAILGYGEMAQKGAKEGTPLKRHVDAVVSAGLRAKSLVARILAFSRSGIGERLPVNVQSMVAETLDLVAASLPKGVKLERRLEAGDAAVMGDPTQIHQVVMNLCANAAQAMKAAGTLTVSLDLVEKSGHVAATSVLAPGRYLRLSVRDTGAGIPASVLERIFDPFFTTKGVGVGTGLGLSLVHGIVTDLGGGIEVHSREGEGSTFTVYLPSDRTAAARVGGAEETAPPGGGEAVLLVDDEEALVRLGEEMIAGLGYEPVGFTSSTAALEAFRAEPERFSAVLSDETMPDMTGSELAREIRRIRPGIPIVLMTGFVSPALALRAKELGVVEVLNKPLVAGDMARSLAGALHPALHP